MEEVMERVKVCGDCLHHRLKRNKEGQITGEHICVEWGLLKSEQTLACSSYFVDKESPEILIKDPDQSLSKLIDRFRGQVRRVLEQDNWVRVLPKEKNE